jgi:hypothetical protein
MSQYYILNDNREAVPCANLEAWARGFDEARRRVGETFVGPYRVSTVFLGINHRHFGDGPPILFETMVFEGDDGDVDMDRCSTWAEAEAMHADFVARYQAKLS